MEQIKITIPDGNLAIESAFGFRVLSQYVFELEQIHAGVPISEIGYAERRAQSVTKIVEIENPSKSYIKDKIAVVDLRGLIRSEDGLSSFGTKTKADQLLAAKKDVIGALFKIDSGGGYMDGAEAMISAMAEFGKPIVTLSPFAASAAYMIAAQSSQIFAETKFSQFGSIGTYIPLSKIQKELIQKYMEFAYSEKSQNKNKAERDWIMNDDISGFIKLATERDILLMDHVKQHRKLKESKEETLAGGMFSADDSIRRGLVDGYSNIEKSLQTIQRLSRI